MSALTPAGRTLVSLMNVLPRGPRKDGAFALWLTVRVAEDFLLVPPLPERAVKKRVTALEQRLSSLAVPAPLRRALAAALTELSSGPPPPERERAALALQQLVAPARDLLGPEAGEAIAKAAREAREKVRGER
ncbi:MAG: hypothetical protein ACT4PM_13045 [Gemmatimonadales bacterium]